MRCIARVVVSSAATAPPGEESAKAAPARGTRERHPRASDTACIMAGALPYRSISCPQLSLFFAAPLLAPNSSSAPSSHSLPNSSAELRFCRHQGRITLLPPSSLIPLSQCSLGRRAMLAPVSAAPNPRRRPIAMLPLWQSRSTLTSPSSML
ncbi:hypothetical protein BDV95DRAFT_580586 [Massariosphaeria phaeospora]|uniref:Uncharacterized protein n=1 Tax=Massariosphaeria phaeospora TaxID=100035 RepID=A0A7C8MIY0_9PLEO|nr:hypothetical protein BDV95DRAFT_580586 [Massariosphaeria phaeospora]